MRAALTSSGGQQRAGTLRPMGAGVLLGVAAALSFGGGDFLGGLSARRTRTLVVLAVSQLVGLAGLLVLIAVIRDPLPGAGALAISAAAGVAGAAGLAALYRGMALGSMGLVTALSGAGGLLVPLTFGALVRGDTVSTVQLLGVGCAILAGVAASGASRAEMQRRALMMAGFAALGFGAWYVLLDLGASASPGWALVASRGASSSLALAALLVVRPGRVPVPWALLVAVGLFDVGGNALYVLARAEIQIGLAAALTGLYPVVTMLLARGLLGETLPRLGYAGVALAIGGIVLISAGAGTG